MTPLIVLASIVGLVFMSWLIWFLLRKATAWGGDRSDALDITGRFIAETQAFRGASTDDAAWDGKNRMAPPTQDGGG